MHVNNRGEFPSPLRPNEVAVIIRTKYRSVCVGPQGQGYLKEDEEHIHLVLAAGNDVPPLKNEPGCKDRIMRFDLNEDYFTVDCGARKLTYRIQNTNGKPRVWRVQTGRLERRVRNWLGLPYLQPVNLNTLGGTP